MRKIPFIDLFIVLAIVVLLLLIVTLPGCGKKEDVKPEPVASEKKSGCTCKDCHCSARALPLKAAEKKAPVLEPAKPATAPVQIKEPDVPLKEVKK